jgi:integrase
MVSANALSYESPTLPVDLVLRTVELILKKRHTGKVSNSTVNRTLEIVRVILRKAAYEWEWIDKAPKVRMLPKPERRIRWLTQERAQRLIQELPEHLAALVRFSLETGLRQRTVTYMEWSQVDLVRRCAWIHPDQAKAKCVCCFLNLDVFEISRTLMVKLI